MAAVGPAAVVCLLVPGTSCRPRSHSNCSARISTRLYPHQVGAAAQAPLLLLDASAQRSPALAAAPALELCSILSCRHHHQTATEILSQFAAPLLPLACDCTQVEGVRWLWSLYRLRRGGILADDMVRLAGHCVGIMLEYCCTAELRKGLMSGSGSRTRALLLMHRPTA